jgi:hypothetical protein
MRQYYKKHVFVVPVGILDWLNVMLGIEQAAAALHWDAMSDYLIKVTTDVIRLAFGEAYGRVMSYEQVVECVEQDQARRGCWVLPELFARADGSLMHKVAMLMFKDMVTTAGEAQSGSNDMVVECPPVWSELGVESSLRLEHCSDSMRVFLDQSLARHGMGHLVDKLADAYRAGKLFVPIINRTAFEVGRLDVPAVRTLKRFLNESTL